MQLINPEYIHYLVDGGILLLLWRVNRAVNKWYDILIEYPPHRHVNGTTLYPTGLEPGLVVKHGERARP